MKEIYIALLSGGKDSTVMTDLLLKNNYQVDYIIFNNTFMEFPLMYEYIIKLKKYFKDRYNKNIITTKPLTTFEEWCFGVIRDESSKMYGAIRGIPMVWSEPCYWRRESKVKAYDKTVRDLIGSNETYYKYIGFTVDEISRKLKEKNTIYPLIEYFPMREIDCQSYLINQEMENPLYRYFTRTGCGICPAQSDRSWYQVWKFFPDTWLYMKWIEKRLLDYKGMGHQVKNCFWFTNHRTCEEMESLFKKKNLQGSLFEFNDDPLKNCFCKI